MTKSMGINLSFLLLRFSPPSLLLLFAEFLFNKLIKCLTLIYFLLIHMSHVFVLFLYKLSRFVYFCICMFVCQYLYF